MRKKRKPGYPPYDDDKFYDTGSIASASDCTGLIPSPPANEAEAESYAELYNIPATTDKAINNGTQNSKKTQNNEDVR